MRNILFLLSLFVIVGNASAQTKVYIDPQTSYQVIEGFSASDCWAGNYVGELWTNQRDKAAKWLFSSELDKNGDPYGIGLSMWRFNIGAGTAEQGDASDIGDITRRSECMLNADGSYDWTRQAGQQYWLEQAKAYGCEKFVGFSNSPLVHFTRNGKGYSPGDWRANLQDDKYDDFAEYIATLVNHFDKEKGIKFSYISPVNEPQYRWEAPGQEGTPWNNDEVSRLVKELNKSLQSRELDTKIFVSEAGSWSYLYEGDSNGSGNQAWAFFNPASPHYIGNLPSVAPVIAGHSYWRDKKNTDIISVRRTVNAKAKEYDLSPFQTEWSMLSGPPDMDGFPDSFDEASYTDNALIMAKIVHADMVYTQAASWSYWTSMDQERWGHKNRFSLLKLVPAAGDYGDIRSQGTISAHKTLWALGNYSLFIRPGYQRIKMINAEDMNSLMSSAYMAPDSSRVVVVYINMAYAEKSIIPAFTKLNQLEVEKVSLYRTNSTLNLKNMRISPIYDPKAIFKMPGRSITTMVYDLKHIDPNSIEQTEVDTELLVYPNPIIDNRFSIKLPVPTFSTRSWCMNICSMNGKIIYSQEITNESLQDITLPTTLVNGLYLLSIESEENRYFSKIEIRN